MRCVVILTLLLGFSGATLAVIGTPMEFMGDWVPQSATCQSPLKFRVEADKVTLFSASQSRSFGNMDFCYSCEGGAKYRGIVVWMIPEYGENTVPPFIAQFNVGEKPGVAKLDIKAKLNRQFPLHQVALKRCIKNE